MRFHVRIAQNTVAALARFNTTSSLFDELCFFRISGLTSSGWFSGALRVPCGCASNEHFGWCGCALWRVIANA
eukprot:9499193-Pyramimonas_sp.AAC.1